MILRNMIAAPCVSSWLSDARGMQLDAGLKLISYKNGKNPLCIFTCEGFSVLHLHLLLLRQKYNLMIHILGKKN